MKPNAHQYSADVWHTWAKSRFLGCDEVKLPNGKTMQLPRSTADLSIDEFGEYMEAVEAWAGTRGVWLDE